VDILDTPAEFTEDQVYAAMVDAGIPGPVADRAYKFTQIAWGRVFLDGLGVQFAPDYLCFDAAGEVIESGKIANQPYFVAAMAAARRQPPPAGLPRMALMSADVRTVNQALNSGSKPEDLVTGPSALFMEPPTPAGMEKVRRLLRERLSAVSRRSGSEAGQSASGKKPWWWFW
jgi:hypothetical protein